MARRPQAVLQIASVIVRTQAEAEVAGGGAWHATAGAEVSEVLGNWDGISPKHQRSMAPCNLCPSIGNGFVTGYYSVAMQLVTFSLVLAFFMLILAKEDNVRN